MTPQSAKAKGRALQQWVVKLILKLHKSLNERDVKSTSMGANGEDVQLSAAAHKLVPYSIECKNLRQMVLYKWMDQAKENCPTGSTPIVVAKANHKKPVVIVDAEYFFKLAKRKE